MSTHPTTQAPTPSETIDPVTGYALDRTYWYDVAASFPPVVLVSVHMAKDGPCGWCDQPATWDVRNPGAGQWVDVACTEHLHQHFPSRRSPVSLVKAYVPTHGEQPTEADLRERRSGGGSPWWAWGVSALRALRNNHPETLAVAFEVTANLRRSL